MKVARATTMAGLVLLALAAGAAAQDIGRNDGGNDGDASIGSQGGGGDPVAASDEDWANLQTCLEGAREGGGRRSSCLGVVSNPCMEANGDSTVMMGACYEREATMWDDLLNQIYGDLKGAVEPEASGRLRESQRAWITLRDSTCGFEASLWGGGTGGGPAFVGCVMRLTAERFSDLATSYDMVAGR